MKKLFTCLLLSLCASLPTRLLACAVVTNLQASTLAGTTVSAYFTPVSGIQLYAVQLFRGGTRVATNYGAYGSTIFHLLQPGTTYTVRVGSVCSPGDTTYAAPVSITTGAGTAECPPVSNITLGQVTGTQATVGFTAPSGTTSYRITYYSVADTTTLQTMTVASPPAVLTNLLPNTRYVVRIATMCGATYGLVTPPYLLQTTGGAACSSAANIVVTVTGSTTATVSFTPGTGNSSFRLLYRAAGDSTRRFASSTSSPILLTGLQPGQTYYFQLQSQCGGTPLYATASTFAYSFRSAGALAAGSALGTGVVAAFPNPAHQAVTVRLPAVPGAGTAHLLLLNGLGQAVRSQEVALPAGATQTEVGLAGLAPGIYTLHVAAGGQVAIQRLAVE